MINYKIKRIAIVLIVAFSIVSVVACGGLDEVTGSASQTPTIPLGDNNGEDGNTWNVGETKGQTFAEDTYIGIYVPWVGNNWFTVSYEDTNRLDRMWKSMIDGGKRDGRRRLFIHTTSTGDLYFDEDYNVRWTKKRDIVLKRFHGATITQLKKVLSVAGYPQHTTEEFIIKSMQTYEKRIKLKRDNSGMKYSERYILAGIYSYALDYDTVRQWNNGNMNRFFNAGYPDVIPTDSLKTGRIELWTVHPGYPVDLQTGKYYREGVHGPDDEYPFWWWWRLAYALQTRIPNRFIDINDYYDNIRGKNPETYLPTFNITRDLHHTDFRWATQKDYAPNNFWYYNESQNW